MIFSSSRVAVLSLTKIITTHYLFTFSFFRFIVSGKFVMLCFTYTYMYEFETSFTDISGSNGPILIKFIQPFQQVIIKSKYKFSNNSNDFVKLCNIEF